VSTFRKFAQAVRQFLNDHRLREGAIYCAVFGFFLGLPFALTIGLSELLGALTVFLHVAAPAGAAATATILDHLAGLIRAIGDQAVRLLVMPFMWTIKQTNSDALYAFLGAFVGLVFGACATIFGAWWTARPLVKEQHRQQMNAIADLTVALPKLSNALDICKATLGERYIKRVDYLMDSKPESTIDMLTRLALPRLALANFHSSNLLPEAMYEHFLRASEGISGVEKDTRVFFDDLRRWSAARDPAQVEQLVARRNAVIDGIDSASKLLRGLDAECRRLRHGP